MKSDYLRRTNRTTTIIGGHTTTSINNIIKKIKQDHTTTTSNNENKHDDEHQQHHDDDDDDDLMLLHHSDSRGSIYNNKDEETREEEVLVRHQRRRRRMHFVGDINSSSSRSSFSGTMFTKVLTTVILCCFLLIAPFVDAAQSTTTTTTTTKKANEATTTAAATAPDESAGDDEEHADRILSRNGPFKGGRGRAGRRDPTKIPKGCKIGPSGRPPSFAKSNERGQQVIIRGERKDKGTGERARGAPIRTRENQLNMDDFNFKQCQDTPDDSVGSKLQNKAVVEIQLMPDRSPISFVLEPDEKNPGAIKGKCLLNSLDDADTDTDQEDGNMGADASIGPPLAREEIGDGTFMVVDEETGVMCGSMQYNHTLFHLLPMEDGTMTVMEISLGELPPDEDEHNEDEFCKEAKDDEENDDNNSQERRRRKTKQLLRGGDGGVAKTMEEEFRRMLMGSDEQFLNYYPNLYPGMGSEEQQQGADESLIGADEFDEDFYRMGNTSEEFIIDVMVPYSQRTLCAISQAQSPLRCIPNKRRKQLVEARIKLAIQESNVAFENSGIVGRLRLVHTFMITADDYDEQRYGKYSDILRHIAYPDDGVIDYVHELRDMYGADVVVFMIDNPASCGLAYTGNPVSSTWAYSVVNWICATGYYSFVHEISHHMGGRHDRRGENCMTSADQCCPMTGECDRYAWQDPEDRFRSIMAYNCNTPGGCPRVQYFSQPALKFPLQSTAGDVMEVPIGDNYNNNARSISGDIRQVARYRDHVEPIGTSQNPNAGPTPEVCGNGICEASAGEDCSTCPEDCVGGTYIKEECGNGICEANEDCLTCPDDCAFRLDIPPTKDPYKYCCVGGPKDYALEYINDNDIAFGVPCFEHSQCLFQTKCSIDLPMEPIDYCCGDGKCDLGEGKWNCPSDCPCIDDGVCNIDHEDFSCVDCHNAAATMQQQQQDQEHHNEKDEQPSTGSDHNYVAADESELLVLEDKCMTNGRVCHGISPDPCCGHCHPNTSRCVGGADQTTTSSES